MRPLITVLAFALSLVTAAHTSEIAVVGPGLALLPEGTMTGAQVDGDSSDGCAMFDIDLDPGGIGLASAADVCGGFNGTVSAGIAIGKEPGILPAVTTTFAFTQAGVGQTSTALAEATAGGLVSFSGVPNAGFDVDIDPFLVNEGISSATMTFELTFREVMVFLASATLQEGVLTTSGAFSNADFITTTNGGRTVSTLVNTQYFVPFTIGPEDVGQALRFQFTQTFTVTSQNGGYAEASSIPEPSTMLTGLAALAIIAARPLLRRRISGWRN